MMFNALMLKKYLGYDLTLDWIHHKFLKLNSLREIRSYVPRIAIRESAKACSHKQGKFIGGF